MRTAHKILDEIQKGIDHFRGLVINWKMRLKVAFGKWSMTVWSVVAMCSRNKQFFTKPKQVTLQNTETIGWYLLGNSVPRIGPVNACDLT
jgi:hypothetical protein